MPLATYKPHHTSTKDVNLPEIDPENYKSITVDDKEVPLNSLISQVEGSPWVVSYYNQILGDSLNLKDLDINQSAVYQQYNKVKNLEIRVTSPLTHQQDTETGTSTIIGSGSLYPFITPNIGDLFITSTGINKEGLYRVTNVERRSLYRRSVYAIEYSFVEYITLDSKRYSNIESKVDNIYFFQKDRLIDNQNPHVLELHYKRLLLLEKFFSDIIRQYFKDFFDKRASTLILSVNDKRIYDEHLINFILNLIRNEDADEVKYIKHYLVGDYNGNKFNTLFDALLERSDFLLSNAMRPLALVAKKDFLNNFSIRNIRYQNIDYAITRLEKYGPNNTLESIAGTRYFSVEELRSNTYTDNSISVHGINLVNLSDSYVLSEAFYVGSPSNYSLLEILLRDYMGHNTINVDKLLFLLNGVNAWKPLERFYYVPLLVLLIKTSLKEGY